MLRSIISFTILSLIFHSVGAQESNATTFEGPQTVTYVAGMHYTQTNGAAVYFSWVDINSASSGEPYTLSLSGTLPSGLSFDRLSLPFPVNETGGDIEGTPGVGTEGQYLLTLHTKIGGADNTYPVVLTVVSDVTKVLPIGNGFTGNWYGGQEQSGHGFSLEVLSNSLLLAEWFVFTPDGGPTWLIGTGPISGNNATLQAYQVAGPGAVFPPNFNASNVIRPYWGTLTFTFSDCNKGQVSWSPEAAGFTPGSMAIQRLTIPAGLSCP
jgi:hypothetical protein